MRSLTICASFSPFHCSTSSRKAVLPITCRVSPFSLRNFRSTTVWVAIPAWSVPGIHSQVYPFSSFHLNMTSSTAVVRKCPKWSWPVTLGGGRSRLKLSCLFSSDIFRNLMILSGPSIKAGWYLSAGNELQIRKGIFPIYDLCTHPVDSNVGPDGLPC